MQKQISIDEAATTKNIGLFTVFTCILNLIQSEISREYIQIDY